MDAEFIDLLQKWWWVVLTGFGLFIVAIRNVIKIHEAAEALKRVAEHDKKLLLIADQFRTIEEDTKDLKSSVVEIAFALDGHITEQKSDLEAINWALYSILDLLRKADTTGAAEAAQLKLREHTLGKK